MPFNSIYRKNRLALPEEQEEEQDSPLAGMKDLYESEGPALSEYKRHLSEMPQRGDFENSTGRKLLAGLAGGLQALREGASAGIKTTTGILDSRYANALSDFKNRGAGLAESADLEQKQTNSKIKYLVDSQDLIHKDRDLDIKDKNADTLGIYRDRTASAREADAETNRGRALDYKRSVDTTVKTAPIRAEAARTSANAAARNAETNAARERRIKETPIPEKPLSGAVMRETSNQALLDTLQESPEFGEFIDEKGNVLPASEVDEDQLQNYELFRARLESKKRQKRGRGGNVHLSSPVQADDDDDEDYEVLEP